MEEVKEENKFVTFYKKNKGKFNFCYTIIICLIIAKLITSFVFISVMVDGQSMYPTLENGYKGITDGVFYHITGIDRFDIVTFNDPRFKERLVKRVIGLPGEHLLYDNGTLYINDKEVEQNFISEEVAKNTLTPLKNTKFEITLGKNEYYVMGDNRTNSTDSRNFGPIKKSQINGVGIMVFATCKTNSNGKCKGLRLKWPKTIK